MFILPFCLWIMHSPVWFLHFPSLNSSLQCYPNNNNSTWLLQQGLVVDPKPFLPMHIDPFPMAFTYLLRIGEAMAIKFLGWWCQALIHRHIFRLSFEVISPYLFILKAWSLIYYCFLASDGKRPTNLFSREFN